jgi:hypothetical protein
MTAHSDYAGRLKNATDSLYKHLEEDWGLIEVPFGVKLFVSRMNDIVTDATEAIHAQAMANALPAPGESKRTAETEGPRSSAAPSAGPG